LTDPFRATATYHRESGDALVLVNGIGPTIREAERH